MQSQANVARNNGDVGENGVYVQVQSDFLVLIVQRPVIRPAVAETGVDFLGMAQCQFHIGCYLLFAWVSRVGVRMHQGVHESGELMARFGDQIVSQLVQNGTLGLGFQKNVRSG